jgi:hypothetical protein
MQSDFERTGKLQRKIDIFQRGGRGWHYACSTNWWRTCRDARQNWADIHTGGDVSGVRANFSDVPKPSRYARPVA